ncbi:hypothetical protein FEM48_Zijuj02G0139700 [Ziziphus jujuba var. spinosa]|uniref:Anticodon-binding domain-containing protein n=1 Tax=Ziziphus jujuba var. spinosa TaxID=714518 RepID=A0A978VW38_ZIZJJ|nr:hypothetical protein FEM48_Zijuj02G0139700 [Ziziphus jujuba var. spinosa]
MLPEVLFKGLDDSDQIEVMAGRETKKAGAESKKDNADAGGSGGKKKKELGLSYEKDENFGKWFSEAMDDVNLGGHAGELKILIYSFVDTLVASEVHCTIIMISLWVALLLDVAWVTKSAESDLEVPIASRPTSETIGVMVMVHGDDKGLVLPLKVASVQDIVVPVRFKDAEGIFYACTTTTTTTVKTLNEAGIRAEADFRVNYTPGWKWSHWEMKGVPLRIEIGP